MGVGLVVTILYGHANPFVGACAFAAMNTLPAEAQEVGAELIKNHAGRIVRILEQQMASNDLEIFEDLPASLVIQLRKRMGAAGGWAA